MEEIENNKEEIIVEKLYSEEEEQTLRKKAQKRVNFKIHFTVFILANLLIWLFWFFILSSLELALDACIFISSVWTICMIAHYLIIYKWNKSYVDKEIAQLKKEQERKEKELKEIKKEHNIQ